MLGSVRAALPRMTLRSVPASTRTILTKSERWTPASVREAQHLLQGPNTLELAKVVPKIEAVWPKLSREEQYVIYKQLEELQRRDWNELSADEERAAYYISYGPHGPRKPLEAPGSGMKVFLGTTAFVAAGLALFFTIRSTVGTYLQARLNVMQFLVVPITVHCRRAFVASLNIANTFTAQGPAKTMTREYQEQMTERAKETNQNPLFGIASENYKGKGHVIL